MLNIFKKKYSNSGGYTACFTGHRPQRFRFGFDESHPDCIRLKKRLAQVVDRLIDKGVTTFYTGMALGIDMWGAELVLDRQKNNKSIRLIAAVPCRGQEDRWSQEYKIRYNRILSKVDDVVYLANTYTGTCMQERNVYMVDNSDFVIAVYDGSKYGGTYQTVEYAKSKGLGIAIINPDSYKVLGINIK